MASLEDILNGKIDVYEGRDIVVLDVTNTLIQTNMPTNKDDEETVIIKIIGFLV